MDQQERSTPSDAVVPAPNSRAERTAVALVSRLVDLGIDGLGPLDPAVTVAAEARAKTSNVEAAVDEVVQVHGRLAAAGGFVTGLGGFIMLPVALPANIAEFYILATRMVAGIAHLRGYDLTQPQVRTAILLTLVGADSRSVLTKAGISPTGKLADVALRQLPAPALMVLNKGIGFHLLAQMGQRSLSRLGRAVPVAGGAIGAGLDWWLIRKIAAAARTEFVMHAEQA